MEGLGDLCFCERPPQAPSCPSARDGPSTASRKGATI
jgi:hypothetical protein